jgi:hypothetical protein
MQVPQNGILRFSIREKISFTGACEFFNLLDRLFDMKQV